MNLGSSNEYPQYILLVRHNKNYLGIIIDCSSACLDLIMIEESFRPHND